MATSDIIETPRLTIEPFGEQHLTEHYVSWLNDPRVVEFSDQRFERHTVEDCRRYWESFRTSPHFFWAILLRDAVGGHVGTMTAYVEERHSVADLGILIGNARAWGKGYATEAWSAICDYLFRRTGLRKVSAGTIEPNTGMIRVMEKAGMIEDGKRLRQLLWNGREVDVVHRALFREAWLQQHPQGPFEVR